MKTVLYGLIGLVVAFTAVGALIAFDRDKPGGSRGANAVPHYQTEAMRRVAVTTGAQISRSQDPVLVELVDGTIPQGVKQLTVLTDENCVPDADGVSHCLNRVRFAGPEGKGEATLRHHHRMAEESCLSPGETVMLTV
jgi:hypothetical protein